ncbi:MAG: FAD-dependent oxidoreductase, partial [Promethearchaeota archaeon]
MKEINEHPILPTPKRKAIKFSFNGKELIGFEGLVISSALFLNGIKIFGKHPRDESPQGIFCANGQCAQCMVIVNGIPKKACMTPLEEGMQIESCNGLPELPPDDIPVKVGDISIVDTEILIIGGGPAGLSAARVFGEREIDTILIDDKANLGGKLVLQTHKFFGSEAEVHAGKRGIEIARILSEQVRALPTIRIWLNSTALAVFSDKMIGVLKNNKEYILVKPKYLFIATGAREKMLIFPGNTLPGVYGAGAFQTLVNRDLVKAAEKVFIVGGGNVGLIAGYHAIQAGIEVVGVAEVLPHCGGYKVHEDKLRQLGVPIYTNHTVIRVNGKDSVESITIGELSKDGKILPGSEKRFDCDTVLIAVGLNPVNEFYEKAIEFGIQARIAGDAQEIAEASAAIFTGKIEALKLLKDIGYKIEENLDNLEEFARLMKEKPPLPKERKFELKDEGVYPILHCYQKIPCNPCTTVCPQGEISMKNDLITEIPYFKNEKGCIGCGKCVAVCPGLAITLVDFRKSKEFPLMTFPFELSSRKINKGENVIVVSKDSELGEFEVVRSR